MQAFITYDVSAKWPEVKQGMIDLGYKSSWKVGEVRYYLPNTSLWKPDVANLQVPLQDLTDVTANINSQIWFGEKVEIKRCIVLQAEPWAGIPGNNDRP